jgi:hypothetical protein
MEDKQVIINDKVFNLGEIKGCQHNFVRMGLNVECTKCGLGFFDPEGKFPIKEANKKFQKTE